MEFSAELISLSSAFTLFFAANVDINVCRLDGKGKFHGMCSSVRSLGVARLLAVYATCFQPLPLLRTGTGPVRNPSHTGACTVYFKSPA